MGIETIACLFTLSVIGDLGTCINLLSDDILWNVAYMTVLFILAVGWSLLNKVQIGMMVGGFIMTFVGIALVALEYLSIFTVMVSVIVCLTGIFLTFMIK